MESITLKSMIDDFHNKISETEKVDKSNDSQS